MAASAGKKEAAWPLTMARYERLEKLGEGINGEVFKAWDTEDNLIVAVKRLSGSGDDGFIISGLPEVMREAMCSARAAASPRSCSAAQPALPHANARLAILSS
ncbi:hypothetical protein ZWY2020_003469 [Hordeum vulgare]|nr:hypothetical protein ZWY2020_003469 [Hordeum vulgare]